MHRESKAWYGDDEQLVLSVMTDAQISNRAEAERFADDIRTIHESLRPAVIKFLKEGVVPSDLAVLGYTVDRVQQKYPQMGVLGAMTVLHGLLAHPETTLGHLNWSPHDSIIFADDPSGKPN